MEPDRRGRSLGRTGHPGGVLALKAGQRLTLSGAVQGGLGCGDG